MKKLWLGAFMTASIAVAAPAQAGVIVTSLDFTASTSGQLNMNQTDGPDGNVRTFTTAQFTVKASAWTLSKSSNTTTVKDSFLGLYTPGQPGYDAGLGVTNDYESGSSPTHTVDNSTDGTRTDKDFILLQFDRKVNLTQAWLDAYGDTDLTIGYGNLATTPSWDGNVVPGTNFTGTTFNGFTFADQTHTGNADGWYNIAPNSNVMAQTWIIASLAPYNSSTAVDIYADMFKLTAIKVSAPPAVPEPATWALMLLGFGAVGAGLRRDKRRLNETMRIA